MTNTTRGWFNRWPEIYILFIYHYFLVRKVMTLTWECTVVTMHCNITPREVL
jgi:hypothetical protein